MPNNGGSGAHSLIGSGKTGAVPERDTELMLFMFSFCDAKDGFASEMFACIGAGGGRACVACRLQPGCSGTADAWATPPGLLSGIVLPSPAISKRCAWRSTSLTAERRDLRDWFSSNSASSSSASSRASFAAATWARFLSTSACLEEEADEAASLKCCGMAGRGTHRGSSTGIQSM